MDYIILNSDGSLNKQSLTRYIMQGNHGVDKIFVGWANGLATDIAQAVFTLPNQTTNTELGTFEEDYAYDGEHTINGWVFTLTNAQTLYNGLLLTSIRVIRNGVVQVAYPFSLVINETGVRPEDDSGITIAQLDSYLLNLQTLITGAVQANTDSALSNTSENPVQNKVVTQAINDAIFGVYHIQGSSSVSALNSTTKAASMNGNVYYLSDAGNLTNEDNTTVSVLTGDGALFIWNEGNWYWEKLIAPVDLSSLLSLVSKVVNEPKTVKKYFITNEGKDLDSSGNVVVSSSDRGVSDLISLENIDQIVVSTRYGGYNVVFYDENEQMITRLQVSSNYQTIIKISDYPTAQYVRFCGYWGSGTNDESFYLITTANKDYSSLSKFNGKNVLIFGDSITENADVTINSDNETTIYGLRKVGTSVFQFRNMWATILGDRFNFKEIRNYALSGAKWVGNIGTGTRDNAASQVQIALNDKLNPNNVFNQNDFEPDIVIFCFGANDSAPVDDYDTAMSKTVLDAGSSYNIDVDATLNNLDKTKLFQAIRWSLLTIKKNFPKAQVYVSLPIQGAKFYPSEMFDNSLIEGIEKMARRCGCVIINANNESGIIPEGNFYNPTNQGETLQDGLHPNKLGQQLLARAIISSLDSHYIDLDLLV